MCGGQLRPQHVEFPLCVDQARRGSQSSNNRQTSLASIAGSGRRVQRNPDVAAAIQLKASKPIWRDSNYNVRAAVDGELASDSALLRVECVPPECMRQHGRSRLAERVSSLEESPSFGCELDRSEEFSRHSCSTNAEGSFTNSE